MTPKRMADLRAKHDNFTITEKEYVAYSCAAEGVDEAYARRRFGTSYQRRQIPLADRPYVAV